jgi:hypothetical protein
MDAGITIAEHANPKAATRAWQLRDTILFSNSPLHDLAMLDDFG